MLVTVRLFARLRELAQTSELELQLPEEATVRDAWHALAAKKGAVAEYGSTVSCAVNADYSKMGAILKDGDEVAFLPPVSGG